MVNKTQKGGEGCDGASKNTNINKGIIGEKTKGENAKLYEWYISKNIEEKKKKKKNDK